MRNYKNIVAWQRGHQLALEVYRETQHFPTEERFGITSQVRRAAYSVPANIAEASGRNTQKDYLRFLSMSLGSLKETEYFLLLALDLEYITSEVHALMTNSVNSTFAALHGLMKAVQQDVDRT